ncbi:MAG: alpha/beta fold hydrolase [Bacillota bacterium]|nr:alpha/beta fold hydrolase [Bacillota bacterium]
MERIQIQNKRGENLSACLFRPEVKAQYVLVVCHGFRGGKENGGRIFTFAQKLNEIGIVVFAADFGGSGQSDGKFKDITLSRQAEDLQSMIDYLDEAIYIPIILLGRSFGGSTVLAGGSGDERVKGFILWSTPMHLENTFRAIMQDEYVKLQNGQTVHIQDLAGEFQLEPAFIHDFAKHNIIGYLNDIANRPVLIIHGQEDEVVAVENAIYASDLLPQSDFHLVQGADHHFLEKTAEREQLTLNWLKAKFLYVE